MADVCEQLLSATIQHLEDLRSRGVRHVVIAPETMRALAQPIARPLSSSPAASATGRSAGAPAILPAAAEQTPWLSLPGEVVTRPGLPLDPPARAVAFAALRERALACVKCP